MAVARILAMVSREDNKSSAAEEIRRGERGAVSPNTFTFTECDTDSLLAVPLLFKVVKIR